MTAHHFSRKKIFITGILLIFAVYFFICYYIYSHSIYTDGVLIWDKPFAIHNDGTASMTLCYYVDMKEYSVPVETSLANANQKVIVRYFPNHPEKGKIYNRNDFWFLNMLWLILPIMLWSAFILSFMKDSAMLVFQTLPKKDKPENPI